MFHQKEKRAKPKTAMPTKPIKDLTAVAVSSEILSTERRQVLIQHLGQLSDLDPMRFDRLTMTLIHQLTNYCQCIPETFNSYYALPGGILDYALNRAEAALQLFRQYIIQVEGEKLTEIQRLWIYALLSASLLKDIGKLQIDYRVSVFDTQGQPLKVWNPLLESLIAAGTFYKFEFEADHVDKIPLRRRLNLLIARLLMPEEGFAWIASNPEVLAAWLALLSDDWRSAGTLGAILIRADAMAIQRYFNEHMVHHVSRRGGRTARIGTFVDTSPEVVVAKDQMIGVEFIKWLMAGLESGQLMINKAPLLMVPGGLLIHPDAFKLFIRANPEFKNWQAVQQGFLSLGLHRPSANGDASSRFEQSNTHQMHEGILFNQYAIVLPSSTKIQNINTGKAARISAVDLIYLEQYNHLFVQQSQTTPPKAPQHLAATGEWKVMALLAASVKPGFLKGG